MLLKDKKIFVVEDNQENRKLYQSILNYHGAVVEFDAWGSYAISSLLMFSPVDLIILDLMLSDKLDGIDIFDRIRAMPAFNRVPIVAVSAMDAGVALPRVRKKGFNGFIAKPIDFDTFPRLLGRILDGEQVWSGTSGR